MYFEKENFQDHPITSMNKSVENLLISSHEVLSSINSSSLGGLSPGKSSNEAAMETSHENSQTETQEQSSPLPTPNLSPHPSPKAQNKRDHSRADSTANLSSREASLSSKADEHTQESINRSSDSAEPSKNSASESKKSSRADRVKKKSSWYNVLYPTYKSRSEDFKRIFKDVPDDERLVVDYSCALQREILVHGRLYVSQNHVCFYANIFMWETLVSLRWTDVASITKEKTALVIPNAILICTETDKFFLTTFGARDKTYLMLFRVWQNALIGQVVARSSDRCCSERNWSRTVSGCDTSCQNEMECSPYRKAPTFSVNSTIDQPMSMAEMWQLVHTCYGDELGLTSDDEDYVPPLPPPDDDKLPTRLSQESFSEVEGASMETSQSPVIPLNEEPPPRLSVPARPDVPLDPTDLSDTTESEAEKNATRIGGRVPTTCTASHDGRQLMKITLPIHIDQLFTLLFTNSKFFLDFHTARKTTDVIQSAWTQDSRTGQKLRSVSLTISLTQPLAPRSSQVTETQVMRPCSRPGHHYSIDIESNNAGIPYADSFTVFTHYCMSSVSEGGSTLTVWSEVKFKKHVWAMMKGLIEKNCWAGMEEYFCSLAKALSVECEESGVGVGLKRKTRRRRRVVGPSVNLQSHVPDHLPVKLQSAVVDQPHTHNINGAGIRGDSGSVVSWVLLLVVLCLALINGLLYYKLWGLEEAAAYTIMDLHVLRNTPKNDEDWITLLQQQESLHNVEMRKWQRVLHTAAQLLRQTEESLTELQMSMHPTATDKLFSVLKPTTKEFNAPRKESSDEM